LTETLHKLVAASGSWDQGSLCQHRWERGTVASGGRVCCGVGRIDSTMGCVYGYYGDRNGRYCRCSARLREGLCVERYGRL